MINIEIFRKDNTIKSFKVSGHAGYKRHGEDIVCSAVSVLTQTALIGLDKVAKAAFEYEIEDGYLWCKIDNIQSDTQMIMSNAILETMYEGLKDLESSYRKYIRLLEKEEV